MDKPYYLLSTTSGRTQVIIDRRKQNDDDTKAMRERLLNIGCIQIELTEEERQKALKSGTWI